MHVRSRIVVLAAFDPLERVVGAALHQRPAPEPGAQRVAIGRQSRVQLTQPRSPALGVLVLSRGQL